MGGEELEMVSVDASFEKLCRKGQQRNGTGVRENVLLRDLGFCFFFF